MIYKILQDLTVYEQWGTEEGAAGQKTKKIGITSWP